MVQAYSCVLRMAVVVLGLQCVDMYLILLIAFCTACGSWSEVKNRLSRLCSKAGKSHWLSCLLSEVVSCLCSCLWFSCSCVVYGCVMWTAL